MLHASALERRSPASEEEILWDVRGNRIEKKNDSARKEERKWGRRAELFLWELCLLTKELVLPRDKEIKLKENKRDSPTLGRGTGECATLDL